MRERIHHKKLIWLLFFPVGVILFFLSSLFPAVTETFYSGMVYGYIRNIQAVMTSWAGFSIAEFIVYALTLYVIIKLGKTVYVSLRKNRAHKLRYAVNTLLDFCIAASVIYFLFVVLWGINYNRQPFAETAGIEVREYSVDELNEVCLMMIDRANTLRDQVPEDMDGNVLLTGGYPDMLAYGIFGFPVGSGADSPTAGYRDILNKAWIEYDNVKSEYCTLDKRYNRPKPVIASEIMCFAGITGIYFPLTGEANINVKISQAELPFTACHELAHQAGFSREDEANFISWLVCDRSSNISFSYSGNLMAMIHLLNSLYENDSGKWAAARGLCSDKVNRDLIAQGQFWERYEGPVQDISTSVNDTYLKANLQEDGVKSYGRMVDLLIAYLIRDN